MRKSGYACKTLRPSSQAGAGAINTCVYPSEAVNGALVRYEGN